MPGLFQGLEIGKRALLTTQSTLQTIGHNVANVNTPGYSRQRVTVTTSVPEESALGPLGSGVQATDVRHIRDLFLGDQFRRESKSLGQWSYKQKIMSQVEALFNEPNDNTLADQINGFFNAWSSLTTDNTGSARKAVATAAGQMTNGFKQLANELQTLRDSIDGDMVSLTSEVNSLSREIARLNQLIKIQEVGGDNANDLRDARDLLIDQMSQIVDVNTVEDKRGNMIVYIGAMALVDGSDVRSIEARVNNANGILTHDIVWQGSDIKVTNLNGKLKGLLDTRDQVIPKYMNDLHNLARTIVAQVNSIHTTGYGLDNSTGLNFFDDSLVDAFNIEINPDIVYSPDKVAAAAGPNSPADNRIAVAIAELQDAKIFNNGSATISDFYNSLVSNLGVESNEAKSFSANYELLVQQVDNSRMAVQGVSLDEEMANMVKFQHAYDAAARVITTMDQALDTVIFGMGIVGR